MDPQTQTSQIDRSSSNAPSTDPSNASPLRPPSIARSTDSGLRQITLLIIPDLDQHTDTSLAYLQIEQSFSLSACLFTISYKDDDGEITAISNDYDLVEAIQYFQAGDDAPGGSNASVASGRSGMGRRITLRVQVVVDYDGPSLSDTASLASMDEFPSRRGSGQSPPSVSLGGGSVYSLGGELEDDAVTVSSRDFQGVSSSRVVATSSSSQRLPAMPSNYQLPGHSVPSVATSPPSPPPSEPSDPVVPSPPSHHTGRSVRFNEGPEALQAGESEYSFAQSSSRAGPSPRDQTSPASSYARVTELSSTPTAVFEQLKIAESQRVASPAASYGGPVPFTHNERGAQWLKEQNARVLRTMIGEAAPSSSSDASSLLLHGDDEGSQLQNTGSIRGDLELEQGMGGRFYYKYMSDSFSQSGYRESVYADSALDRRISTSSQNLAWLAKHRTMPGPSKRAAPLPSSHEEADPTPSIYDRPLPNIPKDLSLRDIELSGVPPEVLQFLYPTAEAFAPPQQVTNCSSCSIQLDTFRYICSVCGEKSTHHIDENPFTSESDRGSFDIKGKGKAIASAEYEDPLQTTEPRSMLYPPTRPDAACCGPTSPASSWTFLGERDHSPLTAFSNIFKSKKSGFRKLASKPSLQSSNGSDRSNMSALSLADTAFSPNNPGNISPTSSRSDRHVSAFEDGYELCPSCLESAGVCHAYEGAMDPSTSSAASSVASSLTLATTPLSSPEESESSLRRSAPSMKGRTRHAFVEKVWNGSDWIPVGKSNQVELTMAWADFGFV